MEATNAVNTANNTAPNITSFWVAGVIVLTVAGFVIVPPLLRKCSNKLYKATIKKDEVDIDSLGPEIVRKADGKTEE